MSSAASPNVRFETGEPLRLMGLIERYEGHNMNDVPKQWERFGEQLGKAGLANGGPHLGVHYSLSAEPVQFDYMTAVTAADAAAPDDFVERTIEPHRSAVFSYCGNVSELGVLFRYIFDSWMPAAGCRPLGDPLFYEVYGEAFDARTGEGPIEVWVPVKE